MTGAKTVRRVACLSLAFLLGLACGVAVSNDQAQAAQQFRPEDLKSVPKSFVEGGGKSHTVLVQILQEIKKNGGKLEKIEQNSRRIEDLDKTVQQMHLSLKRLAKE